MKILWDVVIQCDREIKARKPDIVAVNKNDRSCAIIDISIPGDIRVSAKIRKKLRDSRTKDRNQKKEEH